MDGWQSSAIIKCSRLESGESNSWTIHGGAIKASQRVNPNTKCFLARDKMPGVLVQHTRVVVVDGALLVLSRCTDGYCKICSQLEEEE